MNNGNHKYAQECTGKNMTTDDIESKGTPASFRGYGYY